MALKAQEHLSQDVVSAIEVRMKACPGAGGPWAFEHVPDTTTV